MFSWARKKIQGKNKELFPQLSAITKCRLNDACKLVHKLFPPDENSADQILAILEPENMPECDFKNILYRPDYNGWTILQESIMVNNVKLLTLLLDKFPFDLNDNKIYQTKLPLHLACLHGKNEIVELLLKRGARMNVCCEGIAMYAERYSTLKKHPLYERYKGTVLWYTLATDNAEVFDVLSQHGLTDLYDSDALLTAAIAFNSPQCMQRVVGEAVSAVEGKLAMESLYKASQTSLELVHILLRAGVRYDAAFCERHPDVLLHYYTSVGMSEPFPEATCTEFTRVVLEEYSCSAFLKHSNGYNLFSKLILRSTRNMKSFKQEEVNGYYRDIESCIRLLLQHEPRLVEQVPDAIEMTMNAFYHKYRFSDVQSSTCCHMHLVELLLELGFLPDGGHCCPLLMLVKVPAPFIDSSSAPFPGFTDAFLRLSRAFLRRGCSPNRTGSYGRPVLLRLVAHVFEKNAHCVENLAFRVELFTRFVDLFSAAGLDPDVAIRHSSPADSYRSTTHTTYLQKLVGLLDPLKGLQREEAGPLFRAMLGVVVLFAGERVDFRREAEHPGFRAALSLLGACYTRATSNPYMQPERSSPRVSPTSVTVARAAGYMLSLLEHPARRPALDSFMQGAASPQDDVMTVHSYPLPPLDVTAMGGRLSDVIEEHVSVHVTQPVSLRAQAVSAVRGCLRARRTEGDAPDTYRCVSPELLPDHTLDPALGGPLDEASGEGALRRMRRSGLHLGRYNRLDGPAGQLPLPRALQRCVTGREQLEDVLIDIWCTYEEL